MISTFFLPSRLADPRLCSLEALLVRRETSGVFGLLDRRIDGLIDVLIDPLLRFALGAFGGK